MRRTPDENARPGTDLTALGLRAARGDRAAFDGVHARLAPGIRRVLEERGADRATADDLSQRVWAGVWSACAAGTYDPARAAISTFAYAVANNVWLQHLRERGRDGRGAPVLSAEGDSHATEAGQLAENIERVRRVMRGEIGGLTDRERWVLRLVSEGSTDRDLALKLGVSPSTAHEAKQSAYARLRAVLEGGTPERFGDEGE